MIRLWNRVGWYRMLAVLLLVGAVGGGVAVAADPKPQRSASASDGADQAGDRERLALADAERATAERAARRDAQRKADEAAVAAAEQVKSASPSAKPSKSTPSGASPPKTTLPIPASCAVFSGNRAAGCALLLSAGFGLDQMACLDKLWTKESQWNHKARNRSSGAYGIAQALPPDKMSSAGADYLSNPATQIKWGLGYIKGRYGTPCSAWAHSQRTGWY